MTRPAEAPARLLVVDSASAARHTLCALFEAHGWVVEPTPDTQAALERARDAGRPRVDLVVAPLRRPDLDGLILLDALHAVPNGPRVVLTTDRSAPEQVSQALQRGAMAHLAEPFEPVEVAHTIERCLVLLRLSASRRRLHAELALARHLVFASEAMVQVAEHVERAARRDLDVLITGEPGTGKTLVARALVGASPRAAGPYLHFDCAAIPPNQTEHMVCGTDTQPGLLQQAQGGTLLLSSVHALDLRTQGRLLEARKADDRLDVRLLATTHRDLRAEVEAGRFRADLFYRLHVVTVVVPPLRARPADIVPLAEHFARQFAQRFGLGVPHLSADLCARLAAQPWPENVTGLARAMEWMLAHADSAQLGAEALTADALDATSATDLKWQLAQIEKHLVATALAQAKGNQSETARRLGLSRGTLIDKLRKYGLR